MSKYALVHSVIRPLVSIPRVVADDEVEGVLTSFASSTFDQCEVLRPQVVVSALCICIVSKRRGGRPTSDISSCATWTCNAYAHHIYICHRSRIYDIRGPVCTWHAGRTRTRRLAVGGEQLTKRDRPYEAPNKADWSEDGPCTLVG